MSASVLWLAVADEAVGDVRAPLVVSAVVMSVCALVLGRTTTERPRVRWTRRDQQVRHYTITQTQS